MGLTDKYEHTYRHAQPETECPGRCDAIQRYEQIATSSFNLWKMPKPVAEKLHTVTRRLILRASCLVSLARLRQWLTELNWLAAWASLTPRSGADASQGERDTDTQTEVG